MTDYHAAVAAVRAARRQGARLTRRRFIGGALGIAAGLWGARWSHALAAQGSGGQIALPRGRDIAVLNPDGSNDRTVLSLALGEFVADVALSPDGRKVAFGMFTSRTGDGPGGSDIVIASVDGNGQDRTVIVPRDRPGMLLAAPHWAPDGSALVFEGVGLSERGQPIVSADWVAADGTGRRTIAQQARYPSFSPDGQKIVYTKALATGDALWETPVSGGEARQIVPDGALLLITYPRYSPDGQTIAFTGVSDIVGPPAPAPVPQPTTRPLTPKLLNGNATGLRSVAAHGFPAEPFIVPVEGGEPKRLVQLPIDDAAIAWAPDGKSVAVSGAIGVRIVSYPDGQVQPITENGSFGAIDWR